MCGIAGFTGSDRSEDQARERILDMIDLLTPRGPDDSGCYIDTAVALGHRRLSIIDIAGGAQPMSIHNGRYRIVFNGEIYNYIELRKELESRGAVFSTRSDTEVILHQYALDGPQAVTRFNGMFAFAIWDARERSLFLARDRIGQKPLYYSLCGGRLVFASELKALLRYPVLKRTVSELAVAKFLTLGCIPAPHTIFTEISKLEPGTCLIFSGATLRKETYWDIPLDDNPVTTLNVHEAAEHLVALLKNAISYRLRSDVPVGVFLSGGIDSSAITALASRASATRLKTFSIGFEENSYDESPFARTIAAQFNTEHHHEILSMRSTCSMIPDLLQRLDEPFADASFIPTFLLSRLAAGQVKVVLSGDGSDEQFAGYPSFQAHKIMECLSVLPTTWRDRMTGLARRLPCSSSYVSIDFLLQQFFKGVGISPEIRFMLWMGCCSNEQRKQVLHPEVQQRILKDNPFEDVINHVRTSRLLSDFQRITYLCMKLYLQDGILVKVDRASMANSLEVRSPFLDHHLVEFTCGIHPKYKLSGLTTKYIFKKAMRTMLPREIVQRRKAGFMMPVAEWLKKDLRPLLEEVCSRRSLEESGLFDAAQVRALVEEHLQGRHDHRKALWAILCFQVWRQTYAL